MEFTPRLQEVVTRIAAAHGAPISADGRLGGADGRLVLALDGQVPFLVASAGKGYLSVGHVFWEDGSDEFQAEVGIAVRAGKWAPWFGIGVLGGELIPAESANPRDGEARADLARRCEEWAERLEAEGWAARARRLPLAR